jgi:hypothetical protein
LASSISRMESLGMTRPSLEKQWSVISGQWSLTAGRLLANF